jgi:predicted N-acetyltransferase YhbS
MVKLIPLPQVDVAAIETLLDAAFGADRITRTAYQMRRGVSFIPALSFAAIDGDALLGTIQCWPVALDDGANACPLVLVGPVAVAPDAQGRGVGKALMQIMLAAADAQRYAALVMIGDPEYYGRFFGFVADQTGGWDVPGPVERSRLLARVRPGVVLPIKAKIIPDPAISHPPFHALQNSA